MKTISIFEPALCCETGVCGASVDSELLRITTVFNNLQKNGVNAARFNLNSQPQAFINNAEINKLINSEGAEALPATVVDGEIVKTKTYPSNGDIVRWLDIPISYLSDDKAQSGCNCSRGCC